MSHLYTEEMLEAIDYFYKIKDEYENTKLSKKTSIINNNLLSKKEKKRLWALEKPKCINCKNPVGTFFSTKDRKLIASCGSKYNYNTTKKYEPCNLEIQINLGRISRYDHEKELYRNYINETKDKIIKTKLNLLFNIVSEEDTVKIFDELKIQLEQELEQYDILNKESLNSINNLDNRDELIKSEENLQKKIGKINDILQNVNNLDTSQKKIQIKKAVDIYIEEVLKINQDIVRLKYKKYSTDYDEENNIFKLINSKYNYSDLEGFELDNEPEIISFNKI